MKNNTRFTRNFINGLVLLVPLGITIWVVSAMLAITEGVLGKHLPFYFPGMGIITLVVIIYLAGWLSSYWFMRRIIHWGESILGRIPVVKFIYKSVKQTFISMLKSDRMFKQAVLVPFHQSKAMGFIMSDVPPLLQEKLGDDYVCVFIPWSINMTSGTNIFVLRKDVTYLDISSEQALQYMLTAGFVMPNGPEEGVVPAIDNEAASAIKKAAEITDGSETLKEEKSDNK